MKRSLIAAALAAALLLLSACGESVRVPEKIEPPTTTDGEKDNPVVIDVAEKSFFDGMSDAEFRRAVKPYLEAWYGFVYRGTWTDAVTLSTEHEMVEDEDGNLYVKTANFKRKEELSAYIGTWIAEPVFADMIDERTCVSDGALYLLHTASGWYGEPDYYTCREIDFSDSVSYVAFNEIWGMGSERTYVHVIKLAKENGSLKVIGHLSSSDAVLMASQYAAENSMPLDVMNETEFKQFVTIFLLRYTTLSGVINYDEDTIYRCPERELEGQCVACVAIDGSYCYVTIGKDRSGAYGVLSIQKA